MLAAGTAAPDSKACSRPWTTLGYESDLRQEPWATFIAESMNRTLLLQAMADPVQAQKSPRSSGTSTASCVTASSSTRSGALRNRPAAPAADRDGEHAAGHLGEPAAQRARLVRRDRRPGAPPAALSRAPVAAAGTPPTLRRPAPLLGEHNGRGADRDRAADDGRADRRGRRAMTTTNGRAPTAPRPRRREGAGPHVVGAGPIGTRSLANIGADVVRVETQKRPDGLRIARPGRTGTPASTSAATSTTSMRRSAASRSISPPSAATSSASSL